MLLSDSHLKQIIEKRIPLIEDPFLLFCDNYLQIQTFQAVFKRKMLDYLSIVHNVSDPDKIIV